MSCDKSVVLGCLRGFASLSLTCGLGSDVQMFMSMCLPPNPSEIQRCQIHKGLDRLDFRVFENAAVSQYHALKNACYWDVHGT